MLTTHPLLVPRIRKSWAIPPLTLWVLLGLLRGSLYPDIGRGQFVWHPVNSMTHCYPTTDRLTWTEKTSLPYCERYVYTTAFCQSQGVRFSVILCSEKWIDIINHCYKRIGCLMYYTNYCVRVKTTCEAEHLWQKEAQYAIFGFRKSQWTYIHLKLQEFSPP